MARQIRGKWSPRRAGTVTDAQQQFLCKLLDEAFVKRYHHKTGLDRHHLDNLSMAEASNAIEVLKEAQTSGWKAEPKMPIDIWTDPRWEPRS